VSGFYTSPAGIRDLPYIGNQPQSAWNGCSREALAYLRFEAQEVRKG
jgi:hypothetical protein